MTVIPFPSRNQSEETGASIDDERDDLIPGINVNHTRSGHTRDIEAQVSEEEWRRDAQTLRTNELRRKYPRSFSTFNNMKSRAKTEDATVHPEFANFKSFFGHMGPRRRDDLTLDRSDFTNPQYGPGLCQWADKKAQARNRRSTIFLTNPDTGQTEPLVYWAEVMRVNPARLRRQLKDGWTDAEIFAGRRLRVAQSASSAKDRWPWQMEPEKAAIWEAEYLRHRKQVTERGYEFRYEYALRRVQGAYRANAEFITDQFEKYGWPGHDGRENMPPDILKEYDLRSAQQEPLQERIKAALDGEAQWRAEVATMSRPAVKVRYSE